MLMLQNMKVYFNITTTLYHQKHKIDYNYVKIIIFANIGI